MQYESLYPRYREQDKRKVFAHFLYDEGRGEKWDEAFKNLAVRIARNETWKFSSSELMERKYKTTEYPILLSYLNYTFLAAQSQGLIAYSENGERACFNTGLQTEHEKDIYATFFRNRNAEAAGNQDWIFYAFAESYSSKLADYRDRLPEPPQYIKDPADLVFDISLRLEINYPHFIDDNIDRLPKAIQNNKRLALVAMRGAIESFREQVKRNYKIVVPHWYNNKIQLLAPLYITSDETADIALVIEKIKESHIYKAKTVLELDEAYIDARLIAVPESNWLKP